MELAEKFAKFVVHTEFRDVDESVIEYIKKLTLKTGGTNTESYTVDISG